MYGTTHRAAFDSVLSELEGVAQKAMDRFKFHCPQGHKKKNASAEIWLDEEGRIGICCYDCGQNTQLWNAVVKPHISNYMTRDRITYKYDHPDGKVRNSFRVDGPKGKRFGSLRDRVSPALS